MKDKFMRPRINERQSSIDDAEKAFDVFRRKATSYIIPFKLGKDSFQLCKREIGNQWIEITLSIVIPAQAQCMDIRFENILPEQKQDFDGLDRITVDIFRSATTITCRQKCKADNCQSTIISCCDAIFDVLESIRKISLKESV